MATYSMKCSAYLMTLSKIDRSAQLLELEEMKQNLLRVRTTRYAN